MSTALKWFKSSYSGSEGGQCVEVALTSRTIHIRDSKSTPVDGPTLQVTPSAWAAFTAAR
ncbi:DUF397 domain-containing protein [Streptomyces lanatus]|uniref:DUF397 domain-containing protein n=1 Tax=Streptomyces lanatus TaxID=66900 RepID=A0ABV1XJZ7_9ACTN|nr:DUF397 domain-containing protein [Streptomyces lanatus]GHG95824.1 DUF397 domain-containing protein [Streptomyces lanatus]